MSSFRVCRHTAPVPLLSLQYSKKYSSFLTILRIVGKGSKKLLSIQLISYCRYCLGKTVPESCSQSKKTKQKQRLSLGDRRYKLHKLFSIVFLNCLNTVTIDKTLNITFGFENNNTLCQLKSQDNYESIYQRYATRSNQLVPVVGARKVMIFRCHHD